MSVEQTSERARARGLVAAQFLLVALLLAPAPHRCAPAGLARRATGTALLAAGGALGATGALALGPSLTPSPLPTADAELRTSGVYGRVRHPIYLGLTLAAAGRATLTGAPRHAVAAAALGLLFQIKAAFEERRLAARFADYDAYVSRTRRWLPGSPRQART